MNSNPTPAIDRIPLAHSVRYVVRGLPELPYQHGRGTLVPSEITLTYRAAPDSQLGRVHAFVAGRIHVDGQEIPHAPYGQHYDEGLSNWPAWLAEEARLHDPAATPSVSAVAQTTRDRIAEALHHHLARTADIRPSRGGDLAFMPEVTDEERMRITDAVLAVLPPPADRAAILREAADALAAKYGVSNRAAAELRRMADETLGTPVKADGRGVCPVCDREYAVTRAGLLPRHWAHIPGDRAGDGLYCRGVGDEPAVRAFLEDCAKTMRATWEPLLDAPELATA